MALAGAGLSQLLLVPAGVRPVQGLYGGYRDRLVVHGKEKAYGLGTYPQPVRHLHRAGILREHLSGLQPHHLTAGRPSADRPHYPGTSCIPA
jgi:hypothetical protein